MTSAVRDRVILLTVKGCSHRTVADVTGVSDDIVADLIKGNRVSPSSLEAIAGGLSGLEREWATVDAVAFTCPRCSSDRAWAESPVRCSMPGQATTVKRLVTCRGRCLAEHNEKAAADKSLKRKTEIKFFHEISKENEIMAIGKGIQSPESVKKLKDLVKQTGSISGAARLINVHPTTCWRIMSGYSMTKSTIKAIDKAWKAAIKEPELEPVVEPSTVPEPTEEPGQFKMAPEDFVPNDVAFEPEPAPYWGEVTRRLDTNEKLLHQALEKLNSMAPSTTLERAMLTAIMIVPRANPNELDKMVREASEAKAAADIILKLAALRREQMDKENPYGVFATPVNGGGL